MAEYYAVIQGQAGQATRRGSKSSGLVAIAATGKAPSESN